MNEKIKQLAEKAGYGPTLDPYTRQAFDVNMFAKLIILECCEVSDEIEPLELPHKTSRFIKLHFGIKE